MSIRGVVFKAGGNPALAEDFVRFLAEEGWLAHWLDFTGDRFLPPMRKLVDAAVLARPERPAPHARGHAGPDPAQLIEHGGAGTTNGARAGSGGKTSGARRCTASSTEGITPEQAVDEAIARIKQILSQ